MGIDARMVLSGVPRSLCTREWLKRMSWNLCSSIGAKHFWIADGIEDQAAYKAAYDAWHEAFTAHPRQEELDKAEGHEHATIWHAIVDSIGGPAPKQQRLALDLVNRSYWEEGEPTPGTHYADDGEVELKATTTTFLLSVSMMGRYYGPGYERGDLLTYCAIAEWCEVNIPCVVNYGGDSSGVSMVRFDAAKRYEYRKHFYSEHGKDYLKHNSSLFLARENAKLPNACSLCPEGKYCGERYGWGTNYAAFHCGGCGKSVETKDGGATYTAQKEEV